MPENGFETNPLRTPRETHLGVSSVPTFRNPLASPGKSANTRRYVFPPRNLNAVGALCPSGRHYRSISRERARAVSITETVAKPSPMDAGPMQALEVAPLRALRGAEQAEGVRLRA